jgi:cell division protein FtsQ
MRLAASPIRQHARLLLACVPLLAALVGGWLWFRDAPFTRVTRVDVSGLTAPDAPRVQAALLAAARGMTTLHVRTGKLRAAVAPFNTVAGIAVDADFPHRLVIHVAERRPVAALDVGLRRVAVTGSGLVLRDLPASVDLPDVTAPPGGATEAARDARTLAALRVAGAAPAPLLSRADRVSWGPRGLVVDMRDGPQLVFGSAAASAVKWLAAARVLAEPSAAGATYLDLRIPGRVAAGGLGPVAGEDAQGDAVDPSASATPVPTLGVTGTAAASATAPAAGTATVPAATATPAPAAAATPVPTPSATSAPYSQP